MRSEEGAQQRDEGVQRAAQGFEEAPVGFFDGDGSDGLSARGVVVGGFFSALSLALAAGGAGFGDFGRDGGCEGGDNVLDVLGLAALGAAFDWSYEVLVRC